MPSCIAKLQIECRWTNIYKNMIQVKSFILWRWGQEQNNKRDTRNNYEILKLMLEINVLWFVLYFTLHWKIILLLNIKLHWALSFQEMNNLEQIFNFFRFLTSSTTFQECYTSFYFLSKIYITDWDNNR